MTHPICFCVLRGTAGVGRCWYERLLSSTRSTFISVFEWWHLPVAASLPPRQNPSWSMVWTGSREDLLDKLHGGTHPATRAYFEELSRWLDERAVEQLAAAIADGVVESVPAGKYREEVVFPLEQFTLRCVVRCYNAPGKKREALASDDRTLKVWDVKSGRELRTLQEHSDWVNGAALNASGELVISASKDRTLKVWDVQNGIVLATYTCDGSALCCTWINSQDLAAGDAAGRIQFLQFETPDPAWTVSRGNAGDLK